MSRHWRVLVVEDNQLNQRIAEAMLTELGCTVEIASDGEQALARLATGAYDLVFMDCQMPVLDGYGAAREWRRREDATRRLPIVALTGLASAGEREKCLSAGMSDYLRKPFTQAQLRETIERWCAARPQPAPADAQPGAEPRDRFDASRLASLRGLDRDGDGFCASLVAEFAEGAERALEEARRHLAADGAAARIQPLAHRLESSAAQLGAKQASALAGELDRAARANAQPSALAELIVKLAEELSAVLPLLRAALK